MADLDWGSAAAEFSRKGPAPAGGGSVMDKYRVLTDPGATLPGEPVPVPTPLPTDRGAAYRTAVAGNLRQGRMPEGEISAAEYAKMPWSEYLPRVAENVVPSTQKALEGFASAVMNPIDTATTIGEIGYGLGSKGVGAVGQALGYDIDPAAKADREMMADALIENYKGRYGGGEEGQFWKSLAEDPMSYAADVASVASLGAGSATKLGPVSKLATNLDPVQAALNLTGKAATTVGKLPPYALMAAQSAASGVPLKTLNIAREVGLSRDPAKVSAFMTALKGNPNFTGDVATAMEKAIDDMAEEASNAYMTSQSTAFARSQPVDMTGPTVARDTLYDMLNPNTVLRAPITYKPSDIQAANDAIFQIDSALTHPSDMGRTIQELDVIKKNIDKLTRQIDDPSLRGRVNDVAASLVNSMADTDPAYGDMMRGWQEYKHQLNNVRKDFGSERLSDAAKARKIARAFNSKYGNEMFSKLEGTPSGQNLRYSIAGDAMGELIGDRAHTALAGIGGPLAALAFGATHPAAAAAVIPGALASSPKLGAYSQYALGRAERAINDPISRARGYITAPVSNVASQVGAAVDEREGRKAGGRVGMPHEAAADQLVMAAERAKKGISKGTESLLDMSDNHIAHALEVANREHLMATTNKDLNQPALNSTNWDVPLNANFGYIDAALGGNTTKSVTGVGTTPVVLTTAEYQNMILTFTGTLTANVNYRIPSGVGGQWIVRNGTTGSFTLTISSGGGGTTFVAPQGFARTVYSDGTNIRAADDVVSSIPNDSVAYSSGGVLTGTAGLTYNGTLLDVMATTAATNTATEVLRLDSQSSGTPAVGIGTSIGFAAETGVGNTELGMVISAITTDITAGSEDFDFVLKLRAAGVTAAEIARITSTGVMTLAGNSVITGRTATGTAVQPIAYAGITTTADDDGTKSSGTYTPDPAGGNMKRIVNGGAFTLAAPTVAGDYTLVIQITNTTGAGAITLSGFSKNVGSPFTTTNGDDFFVYITKCNAFTLANVVALQ